MTTLVYSLEPSRRAWRTTPVQLRVLRSRQPSQPLPPFTPRPLYMAEFAGYGPIALGVADRCARAAATAWLGQVALAGDTSGREFGRVALTPGRPDAVEVAVLYKPASNAAVTRAQGRGSKGVAKEAELAGILPARDRGGEHRGGEHISDVMTGAQTAPSQPSLEVLEVDILWPRWVALRRKYVVWRCALVHTKTQPRPQDAFT